MLFLTKPSQIPFITKLTKELGLVSGEYTIVSDREELKAEVEKDIAENAVIFLETSLNWNNHSLANFYGFEVAADLRRVHGLRNTIVFASFMSAEYFKGQAKTETKYHILFGSGSYFLRYPFQVVELQQIINTAKPLDAATLHDVVTMLCDLKGVVIDKLNHRLIFENGLVAAQNALAEAAPFIPARQKELIGYDAFAAKLEAALTENKRDEFQSVKEVLLKACTMHLTQSASVEEASSSKKHEILLVDDRKNELERYKEKLSADFIVRTATRSDEAIEILNNDSGNSIMAVISDWRLFEDDSLTFWQQRQGYEVLEHSARTGLRALFALTSQADYVVHQIRNLLGIKFSMQKKENLALDGQWQMFRSILLDACVETAEVISGIPEGTGWKKIDDKKKDSKSLHQQYLEKRNSPEWTTYEAYITTHANAIWEYYEKYINGELDDALQDFSVKFGYELKGRIDGVLIARRVCLGLLYNPGKIYQNIMGENYPRIDVFSVFKNRPFDLEVEKCRKPGVDLEGKSVEEYALNKLKNGMTNVLNSTLCLGDEFASGKGVLHEERNWIAKKGFKMDLEYRDEEFYFEKEEKIIAIDEEEEEKVREKIERGPSAKDLQEVEKINLDEDSIEEEDET